MSHYQNQCKCKVGKVTSKYELPDVDTKLVTEWNSGKSIRTLTEELNKDLIEAELATANVSQLEWSRSPVYEALYTDELTDAEEIEIRRELDRVGIDVEELSSDLVSHQTVYRHLKQCLGESNEGNVTSAERRKKAENTVYALQQRTEKVTESVLDSLESAGISDLGDGEVLVNIQVVCGDCGQSMDFDTAINEGCACVSK